MYQRPRQSSFEKVINSKLFLILSLVILALVIFTLLKIIYHRLQIKGEVTSLEEKIENLEKNNLELTNLIDYLNTDAFKEKAARKELGLKKPDEKIVIITNKQSNSNQKNLSSQTSTTTTQVISNPQKWWQYFFE